MRPTLREGPGRRRGLRTTHRRLLGGSIYEENNRLRAENAEAKRKAEEAEMKVKMFPGAQQVNNSPEVNGLKYYGISVGSPVYSQRFDAGAGGGSNSPERAIYSGETAVQRGMQVL